MAWEGGRDYRARSTGHVLDGREGAHRWGKSFSLSFSLSFFPLSWLVCLTIWQVQAMEGKEGRKEGVGNSAMPCQVQQAGASQPTLASGRTDGLRRPAGRVGALRD
ncbi:hypothetical protein LZ31DRAFT_86068 [Colletotrichum somersetense]|nr:hypothetical protein LZ31DRAFT_86068 [Colletotrichum somersetense]